ncbi:MAG: hypothetical protein IJ880_08000 [Bacilli bacterium]|nr:hypothetical protein [Bacilli bacterium]
MNKKLRRTLSIIRRLLTVIIITWLAILGLLSLFTTKSNASIEGINQEYKKILVSPGDTIWSISKIEQNNNEFFKDKSLDQVIYTIEQTNNIDGIIYVGQELQIPIY